MSGGHASSAIRLTTRRCLAAAIAAVLLAFGMWSFVGVSYPDDRVILDRGNVYYDVSDLVTPTVRADVAAFSSIAEVSAEVSRRLPGYKLIAFPNNRDLIYRGTWLDQMRIRRALAAIREAHGVQP
jgi:hypothetical protein